MKFLIEAKLRKIDDQVSVYISFLVLQTIALLSLPTINITVALFIKLSVFLHNYLAV